MGTCGGGVDGGGSSCTTGGTGGTGGTSGGGCDGTVGGME